jgi:hypothetical protein
MDLWSPPHDAPHLLEWWRPLMLVSRRARADRFPWPVHLDEFRLAGRVKRRPRPDIWIYDHHENGGSVCVDATGQTYGFTATPNGKGVGQFRPCPVRTALWRARLPDVVEPVSYERRGRGRWDDPSPDYDDGEGGLGGGDDRDGDDRDGDDRDGGGWGGGRRDGGGQGCDAVPSVRGDPSIAGGRRVVRRGHLTLIAG